LFIHHIFLMSDWSIVPSDDQEIAPLLRAGISPLHHLQLFSRHALLHSPPRRTLFLEIFEQVRQRYRFVVIGDVVMPEHFHSIISEPEQGTPSTVMQVLKQRFARVVLKEWREHNQGRTDWLWDECFGEGHVWQRRFYDFPISTKEKRIEKLRYIHRNPVRRGLVLAPEQWEWSSYRDYAGMATGIVLVNEKQHAPMRVRKVDAIATKARAG
jgi:putative transposase